LLLGEGLFDRRQSVEDRIEELAQIFAVGVGGFSVMDNHLHLLVRLDQKVAGDWSDDEVVRRWGRLCRELASPDGEAQEWPIVRPFLRGQPPEVTGPGGSLEGATSGQPRGMRSPVTNA
jgi:hypothetical protein